MTETGPQDPRDELVTHLPALRAFALSLTRNSSSADDLVQDTVVKAWSNFDKFETGTNLRAWLFTILRNTFYSGRRKAKREVEDVDGAFTATLAEKPEHDGKLQLADFFTAFAQLSAEQREALSLVGAQGFSYEEAAEMCGVAVGTIKSRANRGRTRLAELLHLSDDEDMELTDGATRAVMPDNGAEGRDRQPRGLMFRVIAFLTIALLPLGLIAVIQTQEYQREALRRSELAFLALTERAAAAEAEVVASAIGAAQTLASLAPGVLSDTEVCNRALSRVVQGDPRFSFVGFIPPDGHIACSTAEEAMTLPMTPERLEFLENPRRLVSANIRGPVSEAWVVIISEPVFDTDRYIGAVSISIPNAVLANASRSRQSDEVPADHPIEMATFNRRGEFLSTLSGAPTPDVTLLPRQELTALIAEAPRAFTAESRGGEVQTYTMTPVVPDEVYVIGVWEPELPRLGRLPTPVAAVLFPLLMWVASLVVASIAMHRLVLVHVEALRSKMRKFGRSRTLDTAIPKNGTPAEFREMDAEFMAMAESVLRDEAQLEDAVREKNILLKEIHHRVKNNLQLLSSITSMKRRRADSPEARAVLRALQDRILSLAAIHRNLYLSTDMSAVEAGRLIEDIAAQHGILPGQGRLHMALEPVVLVPQQAVPLSLLVAEALGGGNTADETTPVEIGLSIAADQMVTLVIETGPPARAADDSDAAIGENLIVAFADQLGGSLDRRESDHGRSRITLSFRALETVPDALDY